MPRFAANLSMMFNEVPFLDRFDAAAKAGFKAVEFLFPYEYPAAELRARLDGAGLQQVLFNMPPGDWAGGERGMACLPGRVGEFRDGVMRALDYAAVLGSPLIHCMAGLAPAGGIVVTLASSNTAAAPVPATVAIAAGKVSATFKVSHAKVAAPSTVAITATLGGATQTATLTVTP